MRRMGRPLGGAFRLVFLASGGSGYVGGGGVVMDWTWVWGSVDIAYGKRG